MGSITVVQAISIVLFISVLVIGSYGSGAASKGASVFKKRVWLLVCMCEFSFAFVFYILWPQLSMDMNDFGAVLFSALSIGMLTFESLLLIGKRPV